MHPSLAMLCLLNVLRAVSATGSHRYVSNRVISHTDGSTHHIHYDVETTNKMIPLHEEPAVVAVNCTPNALYIRVTDNSTMLNWPDKALVVGGAEWNCTDHVGSPRPFYRRVVTMKWQTSTSAILQTKDEPLEHCFRKAKIYVKYMPANHTGHPESHRAKHQRNKKKYRESYERHLSTHRKLFIFSAMKKAFNYVVKPVKAAIKQSVNTAAGVIQRSVSTAVKRGSKAVKFVASAATGAVNIVTALADVIANGQVSMQEQVKFTKSFNYANGGADNPRIQLAEQTTSDNINSFSAQQTMSADCVDCYIEISAGFEFQMDVSVAISLNPAVLDRLMLKVFGSLKANAGIEVATSSRFTESIAKQMINDIPLASQTFMAGPIPVRIEATLGVQVRAEMSVQSGTIRAGFHTDNYVEMGTEYRAAWNGFRPLPPTYHSTGLNFESPDVDVTSAAVKLALVPQLTVRLYETVGIEFALVPFIDVKTKTGGSGCSSAEAAQYSISWGLDFEVVVPEIEIDIFKAYGGKTITIGSPVLPLKLADLHIIGPHIAKEGCISRPGSELSYSWQAEDWGACTVTCGQGFRHRDVSCVTQSLANPVDSTYCSSISTQPASSMPCTITECSQQAAPCDCPSNLLGNGICDDECNKAECGWDGVGDKEPPDCAGGYSSDCEMATTCSDCILDYLDCGWCSSSNKCLSTTSAASCAGALSINVCAATEPRIQITWPPDSSTIKVGGGPYSISWSGGPSASAVKLRLMRDGEAFSGFGIPADAVSNTNLFQWQFTEGMPTANYQLLIYSVDDPTNYQLTDPFHIDGRLVGYKWQPGDWPECTEKCTTANGSTRSRTVSCIQYDQVCQASGNCPIVSESKCNAALKPKSQDTCYTPECRDYCAPAVPVCQPGGQWHGSCPCQCVVRQQGKSESQCLFQDPSGFGYFGCTINGVLACCKDAQGYMCDDGCQGIHRSGTQQGQLRAFWKLRSSTQCTKSCGGGTVSKSYICTGLYDDGTDDDLHCYDNYDYAKPWCAGEDPSGDYECNTDPCETFAWNTTASKSCSRGCGTGTQTRQVFCVSSSVGIVADSACSSVGTKPSETHDCNTISCEDLQLAVTSPTAISSWLAGSAYNITWTGGTQYGSVMLQMLDENGDITALPGHDEADLIVDNVGQFNWEIPADCTRYGNMRVVITSMTPPQSNIANSSSFWLRGNRAYDLTFSDSDSSTSQVEMYFVSSTDGVTHQLTVGPIPAITTHTTSISIHDVGSIGRIGIRGEWQGGGSLTVTSTNADGTAQDNSFGIFASVGATPLYRSDCFDASNCGACSNITGCGWCESTATCLSGSTEAPSGCSLADQLWITGPQSCPDPCVAQSTCSPCLSMQGCRWCTGTLQCQSVAHTTCSSFLSMIASCPSDTFSPSASPTAQPSALPTSSPSPVPVVLADAGADLVLHWSAAMSVALDGSNSTACRSCEVATCSGHGQCSNTALDVQCTCAGGFQGMHCNEETASPTPAPTMAPTGNPTSSFPTSYPTPVPTTFPTPFPTTFPTPFPTPFPTLAPTTTFPTSFPTRAPTADACANINCEQRGTCRRSGSSYYCDCNGGWFSESTASGGSGLADCKCTYHENNFGYAVATYNQGYHDYTMYTGSKSGNNIYCFQGLGNRRHLTSGSSCYLWEVVSEPSTSSIVIAAPSELATSATSVSPGNYIFRLTVTDNLGRSDSSTVSVTVQGPPTIEPTSTPSATPTDDPTTTPTLEPTSTPSATPTDDPTTTPTLEPTSTPSATPTDDPTTTPTSGPTSAPTVLPGSPTSEPTSTPSATPTDDRTTTPTSGPTSASTVLPGSPTSEPTSTPSATPTDDRTTTPTSGPTSAPTVLPGSPTSEPTSTPSATPTDDPTISSSPTTVTSPPTQTTKVRRSIRIVFALGGYTKASFNALARITFKRALAFVFSVTVLDVVLMVEDNPTMARRLTEGISVAAVISVDDEASAVALSATAKSPFVAETLTSEYVTRMASQGQSVPAHMGSISIDENSADVPQLESENESHPLVFASVGIVCTLAVFVAVLLYFRRKLKRPDSELQSSEDVVSVHNPAFNPVGHNDSQEGITRGRSATEIMVASEAAAI